MERFLIPFFAMLLPLGYGLAPVQSHAAPSCSDLAETAGAQAGIPAGLMSAISLVETGRNGESWPWTLNEGGKGMHFDTKAEALAYLTEAVQRGVTNIDVGCMQLNFRWHATGFVSLEDMLDPVLNTRYAALFLTELEKRLGSWEEATQNYHSADAERGRRYAQKVAQAMGLPVEPDTDLAQAEGPVEDMTNPMAASMTGRVMGMLVSSAEPLVTVSSDPVSALPAPGSVHLPDKVLAMLDRPVILRKKEELPARLGNRWAAIQAAREHLSVTN